MCLGVFPEKGNPFEILKIFKPWDSPDALSVREEGDTKPT